MPVKSKPTTDPVADMLSRIRNALAVGHAEVSVPHSQLKQQLAAVLKQAGFINSFTQSKETPMQLQISLFGAGQNAKITQLRRVSKPGRRVYVGYSQIPKVRGGRGVCVVSTSAGLLTDAEARKRKLGGELICKVW